MNPGCAPKWVFPTHPPDQTAQATINPWPPCPMTRLPTPKYFEPSAMPTQDGLRLNHLHRIKKARPKPRHPYEQSAITTMQSKPLDVMALVPRNAARETSSSDKRVHERRIKALHVDELMIGAKIALEETVRCCACFSLDALTEIGLFRLFSPHRVAPACASLRTAGR